MSENLLTPSVIKLFGRVMNDLQFHYDPKTVVSGYDNFLQRQLANGSISVKITGVITANPSPPPAFLNTVSGVSTMVGLSYGMGVSASYPPPAGSPAGTPDIEVFSAGTVISTVGPGNSFTVSPPPINPMPPGAANVSLLVECGLKQTPRLARIYGFSFEGAYYGLPRPPIFLVHGTGLPIDTPANTWSKFESSGVMAREWDFSSQDNGGDLRYWEYEKGDFSIRLDPEAGPLEQILLVAALRAGVDRADRSGMQLSGMQLSGMQLSGMQLSGMQLGANPGGRNGR
jgi:hypothetical protein